VAAAQARSVTTPRGVLLDTSVIIDLDSLDLGELADRPATLSAVTIAELAYGLDVGDAAQRAARAERFYRLLNGYPVLPFDTAAAKLFGVLAATLREGGRNPRPRRMDLQIAATAASNGLPLLTRNPDDLAGLDGLVAVLAV
jgi:predicted nucleic acid-binding protein